MIDSINDLKKQAADKAVQYIENGMTVGLGTGSTTCFAIRKIGELKDKGILDRIHCIPSSIKTEEEARSLRIPLTTLEEHPVIDITIDGADEVDPELGCPKVAYTCPYWEKDSTKDKYESGYCHYIEKGDWDLNREKLWKDPRSGKTSTAEEWSGYFSILWDQCKECYENMGEEDEDEK